MALPLQVTGVEFNAPTTRIEVRWTAAQADPAVTSYEYKLADLGQDFDDVEWVDTGSVNIVVSFPDLERGRSYKILVRALNSEGAGTPSAALNFKVPLRTGGKPFARLRNGDTIQLSNMKGLQPNSRGVERGVGPIKGGRFQVANIDVAAGTFDLAGVDGRDYDVWIEGGYVYPAFFRIADVKIDDFENKVSWRIPASDNPRNYIIYRDEIGSFNYVGTTTREEFEDAGIVADFSSSLPRHRRLFEQEGTYPRATAYFDQRRVFAGSDQRPATIYLSQIGRFFDFSQHTPLLATDSIEATLAEGKYSLIRHMVSVEDLLVFTDSGEFRVNGAGGGTITPQTLTPLLQTSFGSSYLAPALFDNTVVFVLPSRREVMGLRYDRQQTGYIPENLSVLASHLFEEYPLIEVAPVSTAHNRLYAIREDGSCPVMLFNQTPQLLAWTMWDTQGRFKSVASGRPTTREEDEDVGYFVVEREVDGRTVHYIEYTDSRDFQDLRDAYFVDSGLSYDEPYDISDITHSGGTVTVTLDLGGADNPIEVGNMVEITGVQWKPIQDEDFTVSQPDQLDSPKYEVATSTASGFTFALDGVWQSDYVRGGQVRKAVSTVSGLWHLEGASVVVLADGDPVPITDPVENGQITLPDGLMAARIHVGLRYITNIETMDIEPDDPRLRATITNINEIVTRYNTSRGVKVARVEGEGYFEFVDEFTEDPQSFRAQTEAQVEGGPQRPRAGSMGLQPLGGSTPPFSGDYRVQPPNGGWGRNVRLLFRQVEPLPLFILAIHIDADLSELPSALGR